MFFRPAGTIEDTLRNANFTRPYGTQAIIVTRIPSSELLGNYQRSLRDGKSRTRFCLQHRDHINGVQIAGVLFSFPIGQ